MALGCGNEYRFIQPIDADGGTDEDVGFGERLPDLVDGGSGDGDKDAGSDAGAIDADSATEESEPDAEVTGDAGNDSAIVEPLDSDGDGVLDADDACAGFDDAKDYDGDSVADGCDECPVGELVDCDALVWNVSSGGGTVVTAGDAIGYYAHLVLRRSDGMTVEIKADLPPHEAEQDIDGEDADLVAALFSSADDAETSEIYAETAFTRDGANGRVDADSMATDFEVHRAVVTRITLVGFGNSSGIASAQWRLFGYLKPE